MKKLNELEIEVLQEYINNKISINELKDDIKIIEKQIDELKNVNNTIEKTGKLPFINYDDIPF